MKSFPCTSKPSSLVIIRKLPEHGPQASCRCRNNRRGRRGGCTGRENVWRSGLQREAFQAVQAPAVRVPPPKPRPDKEPGAKGSRHRLWCVCGEDKALRWRFSPAAEAISCSGAIWADALENLFMLIQCSFMFYKYLVWAGH